MAWCLPLGTEPLPEPITNEVHWHSFQVNVCFILKISVVLRDSEVIMNAMASQITHTRRVSGGRPLYYRQARETNSPCWHLPSQVKSRISLKPGHFADHQWPCLKHEIIARCFINSVTGEFPLQRSVTRSFDICFDLRLNKQLSKQSWVWWFETPSCSVWRHCNACLWHELQNITEGNWHTVWRNAFALNVRLILLTDWVLAKQTPWNTNRPKFCLTEQCYELLGLARRNNG